MEQPSKEYIIGIDQGTTSTRAVVFDERGILRFKSQTSIQSSYPAQGHVEQNPWEYVTKARASLGRVWKKMSADQRSLVKGIGVTNQRETTILFNIETGQPLFQAIVWSDSRTQHLIQELLKKDNVDKVKEITGLPLNSYFPALKIRWLLDHNVRAKQLFAQGKLAFATVDSWIIYNLTGGAKNDGVHITDTSNALRSMLVNKDTLEYDDFLIDFFGLRGLILPEIRSCSEVYGNLKETPWASYNLPIAGCIGDQSAALVGHLGFSKGDAKSTYGTGCFMLYNTGTTPVRSKHGLLTSVGFHQKGKDPIYALEGSVAVCGSVVRWLKSMNICETPAEIGVHAQHLKHNHGVYFVTAFNGLLAPYWDETARGSTFGLSYGTTNSHYLRASAEAISYQVKAILDVMTSESGMTLETLKVDGGLSNSDEIMTIQSNVLGIQVHRSPMTEPTSLGAAIAAGLALGVWKDFDDIKSKFNDTVDAASVFEPTEWDADVRAYFYEKWENAVKHASMYGKDEEELEKRYPGIQTKLSNIGTGKPLQDVKGPQQQPQPPQAVESKKELTSDGRVLDEILTAWANTSSPDGEVAPPESFFGKEEPVGEEDFYELEHGTREKR